MADTENANVIPFLRDQSEEEDFSDGCSILLGKIKRDEWELWVCLHKNGSISLKWWSWMEDLQTFCPKADFESIDLTPSDLAPLSEVLTAVGNDPIISKAWPLLPPSAAVIALQISGGLALAVGSDRLVSSSNPTQIKNQPSV